MDHRIPGIACIVGAVTLFVLQDALIKWLSGDYPLHEIVLVRSVIAIAIVLFVMRFEGGNPLAAHTPSGPATGTLRCSWSPPTARSYLALAAMTIAEATSLFFIAPLADHCALRTRAARDGRPAPLGGNVSGSRG